MASERTKAIARMLTATIPRAPYLDAEAIRSAAGARHMRDLSPGAAVWLAAIARIRHEHTEYDSLRDEGYEREEALFFVLTETNAVLDRWGATRRLSSDADEVDDGAEIDRAGETAAQMAGEAGTRRRLRPDRQS